MCVEEVGRGKSGQRRHEECVVEDQHLLEDEIRRLGLDVGDRRSERAVGKSPAHCIPGLSRPRLGGVCGAHSHGRCQPSTSDGLGQPRVKSGKVDGHGNSVVTHLVGAAAERPPPTDEDGGALPTEARWCPAVNASSASRTSCRRSPAARSSSTSDPPVNGGYEGITACVPEAKVKSSLRKVKVASGVAAPVVQSTAFTSKRPGSSSATVTVPAPSPRT